MKKMFKIAIFLIVGVSFSAVPVFAEDMSKLLGSIKLSGVIEIEAGHESMDFKDPASTDTDSSDIALATVELGVDADGTVCHSVIEGALEKLIAFTGNFSPVVKFVQQYFYDRFLVQYPL